MAKRCSTKKCITPRTSWWKKELGVNWYDLSEDEVLLYVDIPSAPSLTNPETLTYSGGNIVAGSTRHKILSGAWPIASINAVVGSEADPYIIVNENVSVIIGGLANHALRTLNTPTWFKCIGLSPSAPMRLDQSALADGAGVSGVTAHARAAGTVAYYINLVIKDAPFAGLLINESGTLSGGDVNTPPVSSVYYENIVSEFVRGFGRASEGEGWYFGTTTKTAYGIFNNCTVLHCLATNKGREGYQFNNHKNLLVKNCTSYDVGKLNTVQQNHHIQTQNTKAVIENCIFDTAPIPFIVASHDIIYRNCYFRWDTNNPGILQDYYTEYNTASRLMVTPVLILFDNCIFDPSINVTNAVEVYEPTCNVEFRDCIVSTRITNLYHDGRTNPVNTITGTATTNGNTHVDPSLITRPAFSNFTESDYENHGLVTSVYHHGRGMGFRTPV